MLWFALCWLLLLARNRTEHSKGCGLNTVSALWIKTQITVDQYGSAWLLFFLEIVGWVCLGFRIGSV
ncbi:hypothetical protein Peur_006533 [Populus x canadensis]